MGPGGVDALATCCMPQGLSIVERIFPFDTCNVFTRHHEVVTLKSLASTYFANARKALPFQALLHIFALSLHLRAALT